MDTLLQDLRYGIRMLLKHPGFTATAIITLALGIGANTAIFSIINGVLLRPFPYPDSERIMTLRSNVSNLDIQDLKAQNGSLEEAGGLTLQSFDLTGEGEPIQVDAGVVNSGFFQVLGVQAALGRTLSQEDDRIGGERVVLLSNGFWQRQYGGDPGIVGKSISLSGYSYTVVGVMPPDFRLPESDTELWATLSVVLPGAAQYRGVHFLRSYWKLRPGVNISQAQAELDSIAAKLEQQYPAENKGRRYRLIPLQEQVVGDTRLTLLVLWGAVGLVLLIACANFANLLLTRVASRQQEIIIRTALGAGRGRIVRQILTESVFLSLIGGGCGLVIALWGIDLLLELKPENLPRLTGISIDNRVLLFTLGISILTGLVFGLVPSWSALKTNVSDSLKEGGRSATAGIARHRLSSILVVSELAISLVLLIGAGLLIRGLLKLQSVSPGFNPENIVTMKIDLPESRYEEIPKQTEFRRRAIENLNSLPGVQAAMISEIPLGGNWLYHNFIIEGRPPLSPGDEPELQSRNVSGDYFRIMNIPLLKGRSFAPQDREGAPLVGVINESMVREYFPNENPIGARIRWARLTEPQWITIVGVVGDIKHFGLALPEEPAVYAPYEQILVPWKRWMCLVVRSNTDPLTLTGFVKSQIWTIDKQIPVTKVKAMSEIVASSMVQQRFNTLLLVIFAAVALVLAAVGIYGVISYSVTQRTHEIGIRMAIGAQQKDVMKMILGQGLTLATLGVAIGLVAAFVLTRLMESLLFGVSSHDPITFAIISALLAMVALMASYIPARRATKVDPMEALRYE